MLAVSDEDLFYRLSVFPIEVPPLRERREDIPPLVEHFLAQSARRMNRPAMRITQAALSQLTAHDWPGNVRELQNTIERAVILSREGPLRFDLTGSDATGAPLADTRTAPRPALVTRERIEATGTRRHRRRVEANRRQDLRPRRCRGIVGHEANDTGFAYRRSKAQSKDGGVMSSAASFFRIA